MSFAVSLLGHKDVAYATLLTGSLSGGDQYALDDIRQFVLLIACGDDHAAVKDTEDGLSNDAGMQGDDLVPDSTGPPKCE